MILSSLSYLVPSLHPPSPVRPTVSPISPFLSDLTSNPLITIPPHRYAPTWSFSPTRCSSSNACRHEGLAKHAATSLVQ